MFASTPGKKRVVVASHTLLLAVSLLAVVALPAAVPRHPVVPFSTAKMIIEVNATDGDAGIQIFVDASGWKRLNVFDPEGEEIFEVQGAGRLEQQGVTELFFESEEPSFDEVPLAEFLARFPEGEYTFTGRTTEGERLRGKARFTHNIPAGPEIVSPAEGAKLASNLPVVIDWNPVTAPFPGANSAVTVTGYQVIVDNVKSNPLRVFSVMLPASVTHVTIAPQFIEPNGEYKFEVLAIEAGGNQTIAERTFRTK
jgi:hypothetical protein